MIILGSNYRASGPPVYIPTTEAAADADTLVCELLGGAGANETAVGGGLTGADLVLTQVGAVPASSGGYRQFTAASSQYMTVTAAFQANFFNSAEWSYILDGKDCVKQAQWLCAMRSSVLGAGQILLIESVTTGALRMNSGDGAGGTAVPVHQITPSESAAFKFAAWRKNGLVHFGYVESANFPTGWDSFPSAQRVCYPASQFSGNWADAGYSSIIGSAGGAGYSPTVKIKTVICSKIGLAAAPV